MSDDSVKLNIGTGGCFLLIADQSLEVVATSLPGLIRPGTELGSLLDESSLSLAKSCIDSGASAIIRCEGTLGLEGEPLVSAFQMLAFTEGSEGRLALQVEIGASDVASQKWFANAPVGLVVLDEHARFLDVNEAALEVLARERSAVLGRPLMDFLAPGYRRRHAAAVRKLSREGRVHEVEYSVQRPDGELREVVLSANAQRNGSGRILRVVGSLVDVGDRREIERAFRQVDQRYKLLFDRNLAGVFRSTLDGRVFECNDAFAKILGYGDRSEFLESGHSDIYLEEDEQQTIYNRLRRRKTIFGVDLALKRRDGEPIWTLQNLSLISGTDTTEPLVEGTLFDITERRLAQERIEYQALHDPLTGLPNPRLFSTKVEQLLEKATEVEEQAALFFVDLDGFKKINDTMGHAVGNELLQLAAMRMQKVLRSNDVLSRLGGDEFTLTGLVRGREGAEVLARKLMKRISQPFLLRGKNLFVTASIGIALAPENGSSADELLKAADIAMYHAKEAGRNRFFFSSTTSTIAAMSEMELESDLHRALAQNELELYYQPQVLADSNEIIGLEALIRWNHPERGLLLPDDFIPLAERSGLILSVGDWVLDTSVRQLRTWLDQGIDTRVAVNISPRQFRAETFADEIAGILEKHGVDASRLELEVTEGVAMENPEAALQTLSALKSMGVRISIDDFGTGYSSLSYLTRFPVDTIKIDRVFVEELAEEKAESAIISAVIALARELEIEVVAEGVEKKTQSEFLRRESCQKLQGFLFGHPLPCTQIDSLLGVGATPHSTS